MKLGFIGGGNMAAALIGGLCRAGFQGGDIAVLDPSADRRQALAQAFGVQVEDQPGAWLADLDLLVLAVKPQQMQAATRSVAPWAGAVLSVAAGVRAADIARWLGHEQVIRAMPNTPALIGAGVSGVAALPAAPAAARAAATRVLETAGLVQWFEDETQLDAVTAISGSGPAYVFLFIEALEAAAIELGLPASAARQLAIATVSGSARLAAESPEAPAVLRERVTSKGGTTAAALARFEAEDLRGLVGRAAQAASARAAELGDEFGRDA